MNPYLFELYRMVGRAAIKRMEENILRRIKQTGEISQPTPAPKGYCCFAKGENYAD